MMNLIYDRTQEDVDYAERLYNRAGGWDNFTEEEKDFWLNQIVKGRYGLKDFNRVGEAIAYLGSRLLALGYYTGVAPVTSWTLTDKPTPEDLNHYLSDLQRIRDCLVLPVDAPEIPADMDDGLAHTEANDIERMLEIVDTLVTYLETYQYQLISGTFYSGGDRTVQMFSRGR